MPFFFAVVATPIRQLSRFQQICLGFEWTLIVSVTLSCIWTMLVARKRVLEQVGRPVHRFSSNRSAQASLLILLVLSGFALYSVYDQLMQATKQAADEFVLVFPNKASLLAFAGVWQYFTHKLLGGVDSQTIETGSNGVVVGAARFHPWGNIARFTWSSGRRNQLNLYLKSRIVLNLPVDQTHKAKLDEILHRQLGQRTELRAHGAMQDPLGARGGKETNCNTRTPNARKPRRRLRLATSLGFAQSDAAPRRGVEPLSPP